MKAKVIRGVYVRGVPHAEDAIVELTPQEFGELKTGNYVVEPTEDELAAAAKRAEEEAAVEAKRAEEAAAVEAKRAEEAAAEAKRLEEAAPKAGAQPRAAKAKGEA